MHYGVTRILNEMLALYLLMEYVKHFVDLNGSSSMLEFFRVLLHFAEKLFQSQLQFY